MPTLTRGPYDTEDAEHDFMDIIDNSITAEEKAQMERAALQEQDDQGHRDFMKENEAAQAKARTGKGFEDTNFDPSDEDKKALEDQGFLVRKAHDKDKKSMSSRFSLKQAAKKRGLMIATSIGLSIGGSVLGFIFSILPFELQNIKNIFETEIGGVRDTVLQTRSGRLYSRAFFFHGTGDAARFDGFRSRGMVSFLTGRNFRSNRLLNDMRARGFTIEPALDANGNFTGRIESISGNRVQTEITSQSGFSDAWRDNNAARSEIRKFFDDAYPEKSRFWRARKARDVYARYALGRLRGNWFDEGVVRRANSMRMKIRQALYNLDTDTDASVRGNVAQQNEPDPNDPDNPTTDPARDVGGEFAEEAADRTDELLETDEPLRRLTPTDVVGDTAEEVARQAPGAAVRAVSLFGASDTACQVKRILNTVVIGSRVLRAAALMKYAALFVSAADVTLTGKVDAQDVGAFTSLLRVKNPETGRDAYGSGSYGWASRGRGVVNGNIRSSYAIGGGLTGELGRWNSRANSALGGAANANATCGVVTNFFFQAASFGAGALLGVFSLGSFTAARIATQGIIELGKIVVEAVAVPMIIDFVAGTVIHGDEYGDEIMAAALSGYVAYLGVQSSNHGFRPLTNRQFAVLNEEKERQLALDQSEMSIYERYFSPNNHRSLASTAAISVPTSLKSAASAFSSLLSNPFSLVASPMGAITNNRSYVAAQGSEQCQDPDILEHDLATDPFCNPLFGELVSTLAIEPEDNLWFMLGGDECNGSLDGCTANYIDEDGLPADTDNGRLYAQYLTRCVNRLDVIHDNDNEFATEYSDECTTGNDQTDDIALSDGTIVPLSQEESIAHQSKLYDFDDLHVAYDISDGVYYANKEDEAAGKVYAQGDEDGQELANRDPVLVQRFRLQRLDEVIMDAQSEELTGDFEVDRAVDQTIVINTAGGCTTLGGYVQAGSACVGPSTPGELPLYTENRGGCDPTDARCDVTIPGGTTLEGVTVYGCIDIEGDNVTIRNTRVICYDSSDIFYDDCIAAGGDSVSCQINDIRNYEGGIQARGVSNIIIENNEIICGLDETGRRDAGSAPCDFGINAGNAQVRYNDIHHAVDGITPHSNAVVEYNYIHDLVVEMSAQAGVICCAGDWSHSDGIQVWESNSSNIIIRGNNVQGNAENDARGNGLQGIVVTSSTDTPVDITNNYVGGPHRSAVIACWRATCNVQENVIGEPAGSTVIIATSTSSVHRCNIYADGSFVESANINGGIADNTNCSNAGIDHSAPSSTGGTVGDPYAPSAGIDCAPGTRDLGIHDAYLSGTRTDAKLCALPNLPSSARASTPGDVFYIEGSNGQAMVNSRVSGAWFALVNAAAADGITLTAGSSFRSMEQQESLFNGDTTAVATPGYSSHQAGVAIDFNNMRGPGVVRNANCTTNRATSNTDGYRWLVANAGRFGFLQYAAEAWHWDALPADSRCAGSAGT